MINIQENINNQLAKIQYDKVVPLTDTQIDMIFSLFETMDRDLKPIIVLFSSLVKTLNDDKIKTLYLIHFLKFYGIGNKDFLTSRPKYIIESNKLVKIPFLKNKQRESINIILKQLNIRDIIDGQF